MYIPTQQPGNGAGWDYYSNNNSNNWNSRRNCQNPSQNEQYSGGPRYAQEKQYQSFGEKMGGNWHKPTEDQENLWKSNCGIQKIQAPPTQKIQSLLTLKIQAPPTQKIQTPPTQKLQAPPTQKFKAPPTYNIQKPWLVNVFNSAPKPVENQWKSGDSKQAPPTFKAPPTENFPDLSEAKIGAKQAPPTKDTQKAPPTQKMMNPGQKSLTTAYKAWNAGQKSQAPPTWRPSGSKDQAPPTNGAPRGRYPQAPPTNGARYRRRNLQAPPTSRPGPSGSKIEARPPKNAPELCDNLKGHKYASTMEKMLREIVAKEEKLVEKPEEKPEEKENDDPMEKYGKWGPKPPSREWRNKKIQNPIRDPFIITPGYLEENCPKLAPRPHKPWPTEKEDIYKSESYADIDLTQTYLIPKHLEEKYRQIEETSVTKYIFQSDLDAASVPTPESPDVFKKSQSKRSSFSSGIGTSVEDPDDEYSSYERDTPEMIAYYASRTPTRPMSPSEKIDRRWDDSRIVLDPTIPQEKRYLQCPISTCACHRGDPRLQH